MVSDEGMTNQELLEELQRHSADRDLLRAILDSAPTFFVAIDPEGEVIQMNAAMLNALGYKQDDVAGLDYLNYFVPKEDREMLSDVFRRLTEDRRPTLNVNRILTREGEILYVEWHGVPVFDEDDELQFFFGIGTDITERRYHDMLLAEREARYHAVFDHARDAIFITDHRGMVREANPAAARLFGQSAHELQNHSLEFLFAGPAAFGPEEIQSAAEQTRDMELKLDLPHRGRVIVELTLAPVLSGEQLQVVALVRDVTERRREQDARKDLVDQLIDAREELSRLEKAVAPPPEND